MDAANALPLALLVPVGAWIAWRAPRMRALPLALIAQEFQGPERGAAIAVWGATVGGAVAIGPLIGGALTEAIGWQWIFFVNIPVGAATIAISLTRMVNVRDPDSERLDYGGLITFSGSLFLLIFGLLREWPLERTLDFSCAAAAMNCMAQGARGGIRAVELVEEMMATVMRYDPAGEFARLQ